MKYKLNRGGFVMSVAYEFLKEDKYNYGDLEESIGFILDNYYDAMKIYRAIKNQKIQTLQKQEDAHNDLQKVRKKEQHLQQSGISLKANEKKELEDRKTYLENLREEGDVVMLNGKVLETDKLVHCVEKNEWLFKRFDQVEMKVRPSVAKIASKLINRMLWPVKKMSDITAKNTDSQFVSDTLNTSNKFLNNLPKTISAKITDV